MGAEFYLSTCTHFVFVVLELHIIIYMAETIIISTVVVKGLINIQIV